MTIRQFHLLVLLAAIILYLATALNSKGYFHFDEHYQILEFAGLKMGTVNPTDLAWEYKAMIRPSIQPVIALGVFKFFGLFDITDPYFLSFILRIITLILALASIFLFVRSSLNLMSDKVHRLFILLSYLLWFLPVLNIRFSSETWSGLFFLLSVAVLQQNQKNQKNWQYFLVGIFIGISFLCRFQSGILSIGFLLWFLLLQKGSRMAFLNILSAGSMIVVVGFLIDWWFYGEVVFTPWQYFKVNILQNVASQFGTSPLHYYFGTILWKPTIPLGICILLSICLIILRKPGLLVIWVILPFLLIHSLIPHKEHRFLFPIINFVPFLLTIGYQEIISIDWSRRVRPFLIISLRGLAVIFILINSIGLLVMANRVMRSDKAITYHIHKNYNNHTGLLIHDPSIRPFNPLYVIPLKEKFYHTKVFNNFKEMDIREYIGQNKIRRSSNEKHLFVFRKVYLNTYYFQHIIHQNKLKQEMQSIPLWVQRISQLYDPRLEQDVLVLYTS